MTTINTLAAELRAEADPVLRNDGATPYARGMAAGKLNAADRFAELRDYTLHELADLHDSLRTVYALIPGLPITPRTCEQATTALHTLCTAIGIHGVDVAADRLDALAREGWRPIAEAPRVDGKHILGTRVGWSRPVIFEWDADFENWWSCDAEAPKTRGLQQGIHAAQPTHWQPLPTPPHPEPPMTADNLTALPESFLREATVVIWPCGQYMTSHAALASWRAHLYDTGAEPLFTAEQVRALLAARDAERGRLSELVPTNWCDPLLTGTDGIGKAPFDCRTIEKLLRGIQDRLRKAEAAALQADTARGEGVSGG